MILYQTPKHKHCYRHIGHVYKALPRKWWQRIFFKPESLGRLLKCSCGATHFSSDGVNLAEVIDIGLTILEQALPPLVWDTWVGSYYKGGE